MSSTNVGYCLCYPCARTEVNLPPEAPQSPLNPQHGVIGFGFHFAVRPAKIRQQVAGTCKRMLSTMDSTTDSTTNSTMDSTLPSIAFLWLLLSARVLWAGPGYAR